ncbi:MAG: SPOR domain-containing protein [Sphingomonas sp.]
MLSKINLGRFGAMALVAIPLHVPWPLGAQQPLVGDPSIAVKPRGDSAAADAADRFDAVGYAAVADGGALEGISAAHADLPPNSFVEVTSLDTGRTILVLVARRERPPTGYLLQISPEAARSMGGAKAPLAVRVRRVNPPGSDQQALREGKPASPRLESPAILLTGLRRGLPDTPQSGAQVLAATPKPNAPTIVKQAPAMPKPRPSRPAESGALATKLPGTSFPVPPSGTAATAPAKSKQPAAPAATPAVTPTSAYFVQIAALSSADRAEALAKTVGGTSQASDKLFRVRLGPFSTAAAAQQARDAIAKRGYGSARVTR